MERMSEYVDKQLAQVLGQARSLGIPVSRRVSPRVTLNSRAKSRFGCCRRMGPGQKDGFLIEVAQTIAQMAEEEAVDRASGTGGAGRKERLLRQILAHEILHTCPGCDNHGQSWKLYAQKMNQAFGYDIKRTSSYEELELPAPQQERRTRYVLVCQKCGARIQRSRASNLTRFPQNYRCSCGGQLKRIQ